MIRKIYKFNFWFLYINIFLAFLFSEDVFVVHGVILDELTKRPIQNVNIYNQYYETSHKSPELLSETAYGLSEIYRDSIKDSRIVACIYNDGNYCIHRGFLLIDSSDKSYKRCLLKIY